MEVEEVMEGQQLLQLATACGTVTVELLYICLSLSFVFCLAE